MQTFAHTPTNAQHLPDGWGFPTLAAAIPPGPVSPGPVAGGGAAASATMTRVRWGRLLPLLAGVALLAFGAWTVTNGSGASTSPDNRGTVRGGGGDDLDISRSIGGAGSTDDTAANDAGAAGLPDASAPATPPTAAAPRTAAPGAATARRAAAARAAATRRAAAKRRAAAAAAIPAPATATAAPRTATGGGAGASGELPMTGLETWIAALLGVLLLGVGICVHVNAVRIGMTALLYRRGILLRPVDCARLAQERGLPQVRVWFSNALLRLLEEPAGGRDFVGARYAR